MAGDRCWPGTGAGRGPVLALAGPGIAFILRFPRETKNSEGDPVQLWDCNTHPEQLWTISPAGQLIVVNKTPALGAVAWYSHGHVAYVERVGLPTDFLHIADR
jgi:hypothetical protein